MQISAQIIIDKLTAQIGELNTTLVTERAIREELEAVNHQLAETLKLRTGRGLEDEPTENTDPAQGALL